MLQEKRRNARYDLTEKLKADFAYDFRSKLEFQFSKLSDTAASAAKYVARSKNVSLEGLCFYSDQRLKQGDVLNLEFYVPGDTQPIHMEGEVRWSKLAAEAEEGRRFFDTGVRLAKVEGHKVHDSVYFDKTYDIYWSNVLETILGKFRIIQQEKHQHKE